MNALVEATKSARPAREAWVYVSEDAAFGCAYTERERDKSLTEDPEHAAHLVLFREVLP